MRTNIHVDIFVKEFEEGDDFLCLRQNRPGPYIVQFNDQTTIYIDGIDQTRKILEKLVSDFNNLVSIKIDPKTKEGGLTDEKDTPGSPETII